jgi:hypothetical protein
MNYKVVPFMAHITREQTTAHVAEQLQKLISENSKDGWEYLRLEVVETEIAPVSGCFGLGDKPGYTTVFRMVVFRK